MAANKNKAYIALLITSLVWGTTWVVSKIGVQKTPAFEVASIRQFSGGILYVCFFLFKGLPLPTKNQFKWLSIMAVLMFVSSNGLATLALRYIPSGLAALIAALYPLSVVLIEMIFYKNNKINWGTFIGLFLGIAGIALVFYDSAFHNHSEGYWFGIMLSLIAMITWAVATIFIARKKTDMNPYYATGWQMLISSFIMFLIVMISGDSIPISSIPLQTWAALAYLVSAGSIFAFIAFIYSMKNLEPGIASLYAYINPIVAILVGSVIMNEKVTLNIIIGSAITLGGVNLVNKSLKALK
ncbi:MAG: EamA family transporter [Bacteroidetes bacterium]|nr:EamA family transporter [Bacteroidota bacterium]